MILCLFCATQRSFRFQFTMRLVSHVEASFPNFFLSSIEPKSRAYKYAVFTASTFIYFYIESYIEEALSRRVALCNTSRDINASPGTRFGESWR